MSDLVIALDVPDREQALGIVDRLGAAGDFYKVGLQLYTAEGPRIVRELTDRGKRVFLDLKLHDIPRTVAAATAAAGDLGVELLTVHAGGGRKMMEAAARAAGESGGRLRLLGVTVLTSLTADEVAEVWGAGALPLEERVRHLALLARDAGLDGSVCSPWEVAALRSLLGADWYLVTPGIRLPGQPTGDQARVASPTEAVRSGASALVLGRAILGEDDPAAVLDRVRVEAVA